MGCAPSVVDTAKCVFVGVLSACMLPLAVLPAAALQAELGPRIQVRRAAVDAPSTCRDAALCHLRPAHAFILRAMHTSFVCSASS